jgi:tRNA(Ile2) C34 agmatinyltransferase TiaS
MPETEKPICPTCKEPMLLLLDRTTGKRAYRCLNCDGDDPLHDPGITGLLETLKPPK